MPPSTRRRFLATAAIAGPAIRGRRPTVPTSCSFWPTNGGQATGYTATNARTPVLDGLARKRQFPNAVSGTPVCCPYRASLLTGQYPLTHGVFINDVELKPKGATWETPSPVPATDRFIGKWHVYGVLTDRTAAPAYIPPEKRFGFEYWKACECSHEYNHSLYYEGNDPTPKYWPGYDAIAQTEDACGFMGGRPKRVRRFADSPSDRRIFPIRRAGEIPRALRRRDRCGPTYRRSIARRRPRRCAAITPTWRRSTIAWRDCSAPSNAAGPRRKRSSCSPPTTAT